MIKQKAKEFNINVEWAFLRRRKYLCQEQNALKGFLERMEILFKESNLQTEKEYIIQCCEKIRDEIRILEKKKKHLKMDNKLSNNEIQLNENMIQTAKAINILSLISEIKKNRTYCPSHDDNNPSLYIYVNTNTAYCFSCGKSFDTIQYIMDSKKMNFVSAVKYLNNA